MSGFLRCTSRRKGLLDEGRSRDERAHDGCARAADPGTDKEALERTRPGPGIAPPAWAFS